MVTDERVGRRDFLSTAAAAMFVGGGGVALWTLLKSTSPATDPAPQLVQYPVDELRFGQMVTITWRGYPVSILRRSRGDIASLVGTPTPEELDQPPYRRGVFRSLRQDLFVFRSDCTHEPCVVALDQSLNDRTRALACPCCGTRYDLAGRVQEGPAPRSLAVPPYHFRGNTTLVVGEESPGFGVGRTRSTRSFSALLPKQAGTQVFSDSRALYDKTPGSRLSPG